MVQKWLTTATLLYFLRYSASNSLIFQVLSLSSCGDSFTALDVRSSRHFSCFCSQVNSSWVLRCFSQASLKLALRLSMNHNSELSFIWLKSQSGNCLIFQSLWVLISQEYLNASARMGCTSTRIFLPPKIYRQVSRVRWQGETSTKSISSCFSCSLARLHCSFPSQVMLQSMNSFAYDTFLLKSSSQMHQSQVKSQLFVALYSRNPRLKSDCACLIRMISLVSCFMAIVEYLQSKPTEKLIKFITHQRPDYQMIIFSTLRMNSYSSSVMDSYFQRAFRSTSQKSEEFHSQAPNSFQMGQPFQYDFEQSFVFFDSESLYFLRRGDTLGSPTFSLPSMLVKLSLTFLTGDCCSFNPSLCNAVSSP